MSGGGGGGLGKIHPLDLPGQEVAVTLGGGEYFPVPVAQAGGGFLQLLPGEAARLLPGGSWRRNGIREGVANHKLGKVRRGAAFRGFLSLLRGRAVRH